RGWASLTGASLGSSFPGAARIILPRRKYDGKAPMPLGFSIGMETFGRAGWHGRETMPQRGSGDRATMGVSFPATRAGSGVAAVAVQRRLTVGQQIQVDQFLLHLLQRGVW